MMRAALQRAWLASLVPAERRYRWALKHPEAAQLGLLRRACKSGGAYSDDHRLHTIDSLGAWQSKVPIVDYDTLAPYLERARAGERTALSRDPITLFERSGGSTGTTTKLIPYNAGLLADFAAATGPWLAQMYRRFALVGTRAYWSLSPVVQGAKVTDGGVPIGMADDTEYFGPVRRFVLAKTMAVDPSVMHAPDFVTWRRVTLDQLLAADDLGFISVWSPTFLTVLLDGLRPRWPRLRLVSCWTDGPAAAQLAALSDILPGVPIQPKGLLATEGVVSLPYGDGPGTALALTSHLLEMIDLAHPERRPLLPHELRVGGEYSPLLTTRGGLVRYHLKDIVRCVAPLRIQFVGKLDQISDQVGEKIHARQVELALASSRHTFVLLAPVMVDGRASYCLYLEGADDPDAVARALDVHLMSGHAYRYARELGQLGPLRVAVVHDGRERALRALIEAGQRAGDIKPSLLDSRSIWSSIFGIGRAV